MPPTIRFLISPPIRIDSRIVRSEALVYNSYIFFFFRTAVLRKFFDIRFSYKHCNFSQGLPLVKMASETVTRSIFSKTEHPFLLFKECLRKHTVQMAVGSHLHRLISYPCTLVMIKNSIAEQNQSRTHQLKSINQSVKTLFHHAPYHNSIRFKKNQFTGTLYNY